MIVPEVVLICTKGALTAVIWAGVPSQSHDWTALESPVAVMEKLVAVYSTPPSQTVPSPPLIV